jgi:hypothetical protein
MSCWPGRRMDIILQPAYRRFKKNEKDRKPAPKPCVIIPGTRRLRHKATVVNKVPMSATGTSRIQA